MQRALNLDSDIEMGPDERAENSREEIEADGEIAVETKDLAAESTCRSPEMEPPA